MGLPGETHGLGGAEAHWRLARPAEGGRSRRSTAAGPRRQQPGLYSQRAGRGVHGGPRRRGVDPDHVRHPQASRVHPKKGVFRGRAAHRPDVVEARKAFVEDQAELDAAKLVFIDEAGISVAESRRYGWAPCGVTPVIERPARGRRLNLIGAIALDGVRALRQVDGYVTGDVFLDYLREDLGPTLNEGDIVVMDGPSIHRVAGVVETLEEFGATALYLPAYSPELNPIEMTWAWVKKQVRDLPTRTLKLLRSLVTTIWERVTPNLCAGWLRHSGYTPST